MMRTPTRRQQLRIPLLSALSLGLLTLAPKPAAASYDQNCIGGGSHSETWSLGEMNQAEVVGDSFDVPLILFGSFQPSPVNLTRAASSQNVWLTKLELTDSAYLDDSGNAENSSRSVTDRACGFAPARPEGKTLDLDLLNVHEGEPAGPRTLALPAQVGRSGAGSLCCIWTVRGYALRSPASLKLAAPTSGNPLEPLYEHSALNIYHHRRSVYHSYGCSSADAGQGPTGQGGLGGPALLALLLLFANRRSRTERGKLRRSSPPSAPTRARFKGHGRPGPLCFLIPIGGLLLAAPAATQAQQAPAPASLPTQEVTPQPKLSLAFTGLHVGEGIDPSIASPIEQAVEAETTSLGVYKVTSRAQLEASLSLEKQKAILGCTNSGCLEELAGALNAERLLYGRLERLGQLWLLSLTLVDTDTQTQIATHQLRAKQGQGLAALLTALPSVIRQLASKDPEIKGKLSTDQGSSFAQTPGAPPQTPERLGSAPKTTPRDDVHGALGGLRGDTLSGAESSKIYGYGGLVDRDSSFEASTSARRRGLFFTGLGLIFDWASLNAAALPLPNLSAGALWGRLGGVFELTYIPSASHGAPFLSPSAKTFSGVGAVGYTPLGLRFLGLLSSQEAIGGSAYSGAGSVEFGPILFYPFVGLHAAFNLHFRGRHLETVWQILGVEGFPSHWGFFRNNDVRDAWEQSRAGVAVTTALTVRYLLPFGKKLKAESLTLPPPSKWQGDSRKKAKQKPAPPPVRQTPI